ncbi:ornithine carbamoyltransferase [Lyngbya confervoides]|uniref:Ornithine carbamoyltransferase n=1 Tax=Lyngbya confervoides BDU141951 TaxID=1574623 RepID=A0ABD4T431_9CYAN|nr:ornithine carbamoyltransferase [Lyngbya confervoides]MCM1983477.1 ornithine carbamoyltransferase [Lyngbya confervoides BDU141951]
MLTLKGRDFLKFTDLSPAAVLELLHLAQQLKTGQIRPQCNQVLGLLFRKASTRTRVSFTVAMHRLGGQVIDLNPSATQVARGEPIEDTARVLDRYLDVLAIRTFDQGEVETFAHYAKIPVINALTDLEHPCQILADLLTVQETFGTLSSLSMTYLGDGNNVANSLLLGCASVGMDIAVACPQAYRPDPQIVAQAEAIAAGRSRVTVTDDPQAAVQGAHILYTDVWASMGQESQAESRLPIFAPYQINPSLLRQAHDQAIVLHCLPAHREEEITAEVIEGPQSRVWDQAENRLHAQQALLAAVLGLVP